MMKKSVLAILPLMVPTLVLAATNSKSSSWLDHLELQGRVELFTGPSPTAHAPFVSLIDGARKSVLMEMYHLTDPAVMQSLESAAARSIPVDVILDGATLKKQPYTGYASEMQSKGVDVHASSSGFSITHSKSMIVDGQTAIVSSMNLTATPEVRRDYGVIIEDPAVIAEMESVFDQDIANSKANSGATPNVSDPHLLWSPVNSASKLHDLIASAKTSIVAVAENFIDTDVINDLIAAAGRGVHVSVLSPACPLGGEPIRNYQAMQQLANGRVEVRQMPDPATPQTPYLHGKMMVVDGARAYVGSINYSYNSLHQARELGIALVDAGVVSGLTHAFDDDFSNANELTPKVPTCTQPNRPGNGKVKPPKPSAHVNKSSNTRRAS